MKVALHQAWMRCPKRPYASVNGAPYCWEWHWSSSVHSGCVPSYKRRHINSLSIQDHSAPVASTATKWNSPCSVGLGNVVGILPCVIFFAFGTSRSSFGGWYSRSSESGHNSKLASTAKVVIGRAKSAHAPVSDVNRYYIRPSDTENEKLVQM